MNTTEKVTMDKFYWYMNTKHMQRAGINYNLETILDKVDNDPVAAVMLGKA